MNRLYLILLALVAMTVILLMRVVGIIMVIALLTLPPATARLFVDRLGPMMGVSVLVGVVTTTCGLILSYVFNVVSGKPIPSGPVIILLAAGVYLLSLAARHLFSPSDTT